MKNNDDIFHMLIYAVDDDVINIKLLKSILNQYKFKRVELMYSGKELLTKINIERPDLILLDIMMPDVSGYDALKQVKESSDYKQIPVIMITALSPEDDLGPLKKSFELGAMDYIKKPYNNDELILRVKSALTLEKQRKDLETALKTIRTLESLLPICSYCKKIRNENSNWQEVEVYISHHTDTLFSHSICPDCYERYVKPQLESMKNKKS